MEKENEIKTVIPVLRFPEFIKTKGWEIILIGNIGETYGGLTGKNKTDFGYGEKYVTYKQVYNNSSVNIAHCDFVCINSSEKQNLVKFGDILFTQSSETPEEVGISSVMLNETNEAIYLNSFCFGLRPFDLKKISPYFSKYLFRSQIFRDRIIPLAQGITRFNISPTKFKTIKIPIPTSTYNDEENTEQQKIADCLSSLDDLIEATAQKVETLKEHKKGLMQRLFPAEGKDVPDLRFPEFQGQATEWQSTLLGAVVDYENGRAHENEIDDEGDFIVVNSKFISTDGEVVKRTNTPYCLADKEDILMVLSDVPNGRAIAKCFFVDQSGVYTVNQRICRLRSKNVNSKLLFYLINRNPYFLSFDDGVKQTNLKKSEVLECPLMIPSSPKEQKKITDLLSSIDDLIIATEQRIKSLEKHKKGLIQQLFPNIL